MVLNSTSICNQKSELTLNSEQTLRNERKALIVVVLTTLTMVVEIVAGYWTGSMALLADGYHMASHAGALLVSFFVYRWARSEKLNQKLNFGTGKLLALGGYTSAVALGLIALWMMIESVVRLLNPTAIHFHEALVVAVLGLVVNLLSAWVLNHHHYHNHDHDHDHDHGDHHHHHDHNMKSALMHVLADALTSVMAILALLVGSLWGLQWMDPVMGLIGALVILQWVYSLCRTTSLELLDAYPHDLNLQDIRKKIESLGHQVMDLHVWNQGPGSLVCTLSLRTSLVPKKDELKKYFATQNKKVHLIVEVVPA